MFFALFQTTDAPAKSPVAGKPAAMGVAGRLNESRGQLRKPKNPPQVHEEFQQDPADFVNSNQQDEMVVDTHDEPHEPNMSDENNPDLQEPDLPDEHHDPDANDSNNHQDYKGKSVFGEPILGSPQNAIVLDVKGTGPTKLGYVKDFVHERGNPAFRAIAIESSDASQLVATMTKESSVKPCLTYEGERRTVDVKCLDADTPMIAYNSASFPRVWCGKDIKPGKAVVMDEHCNDTTVHLFPVEAPPVSGEGMEAIIITGHKDVELHESDTEDVQCNIPCQQEKGMAGTKLYIDGESWSLTQTWAGTSDYNAKIERTDYLDDKYYSTQSFKSSVPLTNFNFEHYSLRNRPSVDFDTAKNKAVYLVDSVCNSLSKRQKYFAATSKVFPVDSYGTCHHNTDVPKGMTKDTPEGRIDIMKQYRFVLAFDATNDKDYISNLIWEAFASGAVPVVIGADNIADHFPPHSFIRGSAFSNWDEMAKYVKEVSEDKALWESYHTWRTDEESLATFERKYEFARTDPTCRTCRWAYAKRYGLGWDHVKQEVTALSLPRVLCASSSKGLVSKPFEEEWIAILDHDEDILKKNEDESESCESMTSEGPVISDSFTIHRSIVQHDGVTDMMITGVDRVNTKGEIVLRLRLPGVRNPDGACFQNTHTLVPTTHGSLSSSASIQDESTKVTILADWVTDMRSSGEGVVEVVIQKDKEGDMEKDVPKRVRVIIEGVDKVVDKLTEFHPSSFGKRMVKDFVDPLEVFFPV